MQTFRQRTAHASPPLGRPALGDLAGVRKFGRRPERGRWLSCRTMPQVVAFEIEDRSISVSPRDADRLVESLRQAGSADCASAAEKIKRATGLSEVTRIQLSIGEDECVLEALERLRATRDFFNALGRLERAIQNKIDSES